MTTPSSPNPEFPAELDDPVDLFDLLLTIGENLRLLVLGPLLAGAIAYGLGFALPQQFRSTSVLRAEPEIIAYMNSPAVLDAALKKLGYLEGLNEEQAELARDKVMRHMSTQVNREAKLVTLTVPGRSPQDAQALNLEILSNVFVATKPHELERKKLESEKQALIGQMAELQATNQKAQKLLDEAPASTNLGTLVQSISTIAKAQIDIRKDIRVIDEKLVGVTEESLVQEASLPRKPAAPRKDLLALLAVLATGGALLIFVFVRKAWQVSRSNEQHALRLQTIKRKFRLGR